MGPMLTRRRHRHRSRGGVGYRRVSSLTGGSHRRRGGRRTSRQFRLFLGITLAAGFAALILNYILRLDIEKNMTQIITKQVETQLKEVKGQAAEELKKEMRGRIPPPRR